MFSRDSVGGILCEKSKYVLFLLNAFMCLLLKAFLCEKCKYVSSNYYSTPLG